MPVRAWIERLWGWRAAVLVGIGRFPVSLAALAVFVFLVNLDIADLYLIDGDVFLRVFALCGGAAAISAAIVLYGERAGIPPRERHVASAIAAVVVALAMWFWQPLGVAPPALLMALAIAVPLAPYVRSNAGFWDFIWRLVFAAALAFVAVVLFCAGVSAILASLDYLFSVDVPGSLYGHVWSIGLGFVGPLVALSLIPKRFPERDTDERSAILDSGIPLISDFVAVPLLAVYALILHAYALKIVLTGEVPRNQIGWMVLSFGMATLLLKVVVHPLAAIARVPTRLFLKAWFALLVVPLALLAFAAWQRIAAYGLTPERYLLVLFAIFLALVLMAQIDARLRRDIRVIPVLGGLCLLLASFGPWGMIEASAASQTARLKTILGNAGALQDGRLKDQPTWELPAATDAQSIVYILDRLGQIRRLRPLFEGRSDNPFATALSDVDNQDRYGTRVAKALNVAELPQPVDTSGTFWIAPGQSGAVAFDGYDVVVPALFWGSGASRSIGDPALLIEETSAALTIAEGSTRVVVTADALRPAIDERVAAIRKDEKAVQPPLFIKLKINGKAI
jgi:Domain of unknown function (DUF4153)